MTKKKEETPAKLEGNELVLHNAFGTYYEQLEAMELADKDAVFDMTTKKGMKDYKSYVAKLRKSKAPIKEAAKEAKTEAEKLVSAIRSGRDGIIERIDSIINSHAEKITAFEAVEKDRVAGLEAKVDAIGVVSDIALKLDGQDSEDIKEWYQNLEALEIDDSFEEYKTQAEERKAEAITFLKGKYYEKVSQEETAKKNAELKAQNEALLKEKAEAEAKEQARIEAEEKVKADILKAQQEKLDAEAKLKANEEQARIDEENRKHQEAQNKAMASQLAAKQEAEAKEREERARADEQRRIEAEMDEEKRVQEEREANLAHRLEVENEILTAMCGAGCQPEWVKWFISVVNSGAIPNIKIEY